MSKRVDIVVAHYKEDLGWLESIDGHNVIVYDKNPDEVSVFPGATHIRLPNRGRESHTYLRYIVDNYYSLPDYVCFLQGDPIPHLAMSVQELSDKLHDMGEYEYMCISKQSYNVMLHECQSNLHGSQYRLPLYETYKHIFGREHDNFTFSFGAGAQFVVSGNLIRKNDISFYERALETSLLHIEPIKLCDGQDKEGLIDEMVGHCFERLWRVIFLGEAIFLR